MASRDLPVVGDVGYDDWDFPAPLSARVITAPVYDSSKRSVKYTEFNISITTVVVPDDIPESLKSSIATLAGVSAGDPVDPWVTYLRTKLTRPRKSLRFSFQGFGDFTINAPYGDVWDVNYGPKPQLLAWEPVGSNRAARIVWEVTTWIPECIGPARYFGALSEMSYESSYRISREGMSTRVITATIELAATTSGGDTTGSGIDVWRNAFVVEPLAGFHREQSYHISRDRRSMEIMVTDEEIPSDNPYTPGMIDMDVDHEVAGGLDGGFRKWMSTISGTITSAPGVPRHYAWLAFLDVLQSRLLFASSQVVRSKAQDDSEVIKQSEYLVLGIRLREKIYGRSFTFAVSYILWTDLSSLFAASGLFQLVPGNWDLWSASMQDYVQHIRGAAGLRDRDSFYGETLISLCANSPTTKTVGSISDAQLSEGGTALLSGKCPDPEHSWLDYKNNFQLFKYENSAVHRVVKVVNPADQQDPDAAPDAGNTSGWVVGATGYSVGDSVMQVRGPAEFYVRMTGYAIRAKYKIPPPTLRRFGGVDVRPVQIDNAPAAHWSHKIWKTAGDCPIYIAQWSLDYWCDGTPSGDLTKDGLITDGLPEYYE